MVDNSVEIYAGQYTHGGSDKVWGGALARRGDSAPVFISCWGKRGASLQGRTDNSPKAEENYRKKVAEKVQDGYQRIEPEQYGILHTLRLMLPGYTDLNLQSAGTSPAAQQSAMPDMPEAEEPRVVVSHLSVMSDADLESAFKNPNLGMTEKVNGTRCTVEWTGVRVISYNRKGKPQMTAPEACSGFDRFPLPCLVDGERLEGARSGEYVMFDLLELDGESIRHLPFQERMQELKTLVQAAGFNMVHEQAWIDDAPPKLHFLYPVLAESSKRSLFKFLQDNGREGIVTRNISGRSVAGNTTHERKYKFTADIDALVIGTNIDKGFYSLRLGLYRPSDRSIIEIGSVRSGLRDQDVIAIQQRLIRRVPPAYPVARVTFLKARTVGISLVEPKMGISDMRDDKEWVECTTDQIIDMLGEERRAMLENAPAWAMK